MTLNKIFEENKEIPYVASVPWGQKKYKRVIGLKQIAKTIWCGTVTRGRKVTGRWVWNMYRFENPVFISSVVKVNGKPKRFTKLPVCERIKELVCAEIKKQEEANNAEETA